MAKGVSRRMLIMIICVVVLFGLIFGYKAYVGFIMGKKVKASGIPAITVSAIQATRQPWAQELSATGSFYSVLGIDVTSELAGLVVSVNFKDGDVVKKDQLLLVLNYSTELGLLQGFQAQVDIAKINYNRDKAQLAVQAVSQSQVDTDLANLRIAQAQVAQEQATIAKKIIRAPFSGRLGISPINPGNYISPGNKIVTLQSLDPIYVIFTLPQQNLMNVKVGQMIRITTNAFPNRTFIGKINAIEPILDSATRNVSVEAIIPNPTLELLPGIFAAVQITVGEPVNFLTLPQSAVSFNPYGEIAYIIKQKGKDAKGKPILIANQSFITVGETRGDQIQILSGIAENDLVVTSGQLKLKNGSQVVINNSIVPSDNPAPKLNNEHN